MFVLFWFPMHMWRPRRLNIGRAYSPEGSYGNVKWRKSLNNRESRF